MPGIKICLVEDDPFDAELSLNALSEIVVREEIICFYDGEKFLDYLAKLKTMIPAFVILDMKMPKLSGTDVLKAIRSMPHIKQLPVIIFSSTGNEKDVKESYEAGANAFVVKPKMPDPYRDAVRQMGRFWLNLNILPYNLK